MGHVERRHRRREQGGPAADQLDLAAAVEQNLGHARGVAGAVVVEHDNPLADRLRLEQHVPYRQHVLLVHARKAVDERVHAREARAGGHRPGRDDNAVRFQLAHELGRHLRAEPDVDLEPG